jgi:DNA-directed RNA polymerase specialized sigma subunit
VDNDVTDVWQSYWSEPSSDTRNRLVLQYAPLVKFYAHRIPGDPQESVQRGLEALTAAIDEYAPGNGSFESHVSGTFRDAFSWDSEGWVEAF